MTAGTVPILRLPPLFPNPSGGATLRKKAYAAGVKSVTLKGRVWKFHSDIPTFRTAAVFCLKGRFGPFRIDRVNTILCVDLLYHDQHLNGNRVVAKFFVAYQELLDELNDTRLQLIYSFRFLLTHNGFNELCTRSRV
ncbi:hypothetical protein AVEN_252602-1 [Araneus ventricosus]|uniref:Uncharacterized protein n=1 Tax=Araneus ventricosus TaxID=182803 RepID=A0A4Y2ATG3_ARAVE|nr:hypothetical protein AVEN_252602-1 [Araneus ventricosus]